MAEDVTLDITKNIELLSSQFNEERSPKFNKLVLELLRYYQRELIDPTLHVISNYNLDKGNGFLLDWIATRLNIERFSQVVEGEYFGFRGSTGRSFSQAPFWSYDTNLRELRQKIGDLYFRPLLKMLFQRLFTESNFESIEHNMQLIFDTFILEDLQDGNVNVSFGVTERENDLFKIIKDFNLFHVGAGIRVNVPVNQYKSITEDTVLNEILTGTGGANFTPDRSIILNGNELSGINLNNGTLFMSFRQRSNPFPSGRWSMYFVTDNDSIEISNNLLRFNSRAGIATFDIRRISGAREFEASTRRSGAKIQLLIARPNSLYVRNL